MSEALAEYFQALERLKNGHPTLVPKGVRINNDNVALEAGRKKGSIKRSRSVFKDLIKEIESAASQKASPEKQRVQQLEHNRDKARTYREKWEQSLCRELSLLQEVYALKKELARLRGGDVLPLRPLTRSQQETES